ITPEPARPRLDEAVGGDVAAVGAERQLLATRGVGADGGSPVDLVLARQAAIGLRHDATIPRGRDLTGDPAGATVGASFRDDAAQGAEPEEAAGRRAPAVRAGDRRPA